MLVGDAQLRFVRRELAFRFRDATHERGQATLRIAALFLDGASLLDGPREIRRGDRVLSVRALRLFTSRRATSLRQLSSFARAS